MWVLDICIQDPVKGAAGLEDRRCRGDHAFDWRSGMWRMLRAALYAACNRSRQHGLIVILVRSYALVDYCAFRVGGCGGVGVDRVADAPNRSQASLLNTLHDGGLDDIHDNIRDVAVDRKASR